MAPETDAPEPSADTPDGADRLTVLDHLKELRKRLLWSAVAVIVASTAAFFFADQMFELLKEPANADPKAYAGITDNAFWNFTTAVSDAAAVTTQEPGRTGDGSGLIRKGGVLGLLLRAGTGGPKLESITPADGAARVPITQDLVLNFNADMATGSGEIRVVRSSDNATAQTIPVLSADVTAAEENVTVALAELDYGTNYHVVITEGALTDLPREIELIFIQVTEGFSTYMRVCLVAGIVVAMPILVYQMIMFILPALTSRERRAVFIIMPWITLMFAGGIYFGYTYLLPPALNFLLTFPSDIASAEIRMGDYVAFVSRLLLVIGVIFELPVISSFLARMGVIDHKWLASRRRWNILLSFVVAAVITPTPDPMNQSAVAGTLVVLYELSVWLALIFQKRRPKSEFDKLMQEEGEYTPKPDATPPGQEES